MKRQLAIVLMFFCTTVMVWGQRLSDADVIQMAVQEKKTGATESEIAVNLMKRGATMEQIQRIRSQYARQITRKGLDDTVDNALGSAEARMRVSNEVNDNAILTHESANAPDYVPESLSPSGKRVFGRDIFNNRSLTFEPQMNMPTPQNYVLGPGDLLVVDVYGASQDALKLTVSPDGDITIPGFGPIQVSGITVSAAQSKIQRKLGDYYQNSSIKTSLGQTRTIMVNVMGEVRTPGTYTLSAFATVFHALYRAGGISRLGTLRNIKVFRQGRLVTIVDVYEFILNGRLAGNVRLQDNDVIQVDAYDCIVEIDGHVKRPMCYEMRKGESLATLLKYSGGYRGDAYKKSMRVIRRNGQMKSVHNVEEFEQADFKLEDGDDVQVEGIYDRFENMVEVKGAVWRPGMYELGDKVNSVRSLIEKAEGLTEEAMTSKAVMRRMNPNRTQEVITIDLEGIMNGMAPDVPLINEDVLFIPTLAEHQNLRTLTITGEVIFPGVYEYADNMTLQDFILQAGGLTDKASVAKVDVSRRLRDPHATEADMQLAKTFSFSLNDNLEIDGGQSFVLEPYDIVQVRRSPVFRSPIQVTVSGEVTYRGHYTMELKNQRLSDVIKAAGGILPGADIRGSRLIRKMTDDERARMRTILRMARQDADEKDSLSLSKLELQTTYSVGIHLDEALANPGSTQDIELVDGDQLVVPRFNHTVRIAGDVHMPNTVAFEDGKKYKYYIEQAGGYGDQARKKHTYIVYQNGTIEKASKGKIEPGCEIVVPSKAPKNNMSVAQWLSIGSSLAALGTMFATIAHLVK